MLLFVNPPLTEFILDHEYAGELVSLGIEYLPSIDDDYSIEVNLPKWHQYYELVKHYASEY